MARRSLLVVLALTLVAVSCSGGPDAVIGPTATPSPGPDVTPREAPSPAVTPETAASGQSADATPGAAVLDGPLEALGPVVTDSLGRYDWRTRVIGAGGWVTGIELHPTSPDVVFARTDVGGLFRWDRSAWTWTQALRATSLSDPEAVDYSVEAVALAPGDPQRVYATTGRSLRDRTGSVLRSDDGGDTWRRLPQGFGIHGNTNDKVGGERLAVDQTDPDTVWLGTRSEGLWRSNDAGETWTLEHTPTRDGETAAITWVDAGSDGTVHVGVAGVGVVRRAVDGTIEVVGATTATPLDAERDSAGRLWVVVPGSGVLLRFEAGVDEPTELDAPDDGRGIAVDPHDPDRAMLAGNRGVWTTTDGGTSWQERDLDRRCVQVPYLEESFEAFLGTSSPEIDPHAPGTVWWPMGTGVLLSSDGSLWADGPLAFECQVRGLEELVTTDIVVPRADAPISGHWDRPIFTHTPGAGALPTLGPSLRFSAAWDLDVFPADPDVIVATVADPRPCCYDDESYLSVRSTDGGETWEPFASYRDGTHPEELRFGNIAVSATDPDTMVWLPTFGAALHRTDDGGATWNRVILPGTEDAYDEDGRYTGGTHDAFYLNRHVLAADRVAADTFYLYHHRLGLLRSTDGGATWEPASGPGTLPTGSVGRFNAHLGSHPAQEGHLFFTPGPHSDADWPFYESLDGGATWVEVPGFTEVVAFDWGAPLADGLPRAMYVAGRLDGVAGLHRSADGARWELISVAPGDLADGLAVVAGDPEIPGRVYIGFGGSGVVQGDDPLLN